MTTTVLHPTVRVLVNGGQRRVLSGNTQTGLDQAFSTANITFSPDETPAVPGDKIAIFLGYQETGARLVFTGEAADDSLDFWPNRGGIVCEGYLSRLNRGLGIESMTADPDPTTGIRPSYLATGIGDADIILALLTLWGVPAGDIQADDPPQTFGNIEPVTLGKDDPAWNLVSELDRDTFMRTFDGLDGNARRVQVTGLPGSAALTLVEGQTIAAPGGRKRSRRGIVNHVTATGLPDAGGPGVTPKAEDFADSAYIPNPPRYQSETYSTPFFETEDQCDRYAKRRVAQGNRLVEQVSVRPHRARPDIYPGMTIALDAAHFGYDGNYVFFVQNVSHAWDEKSIKTTLALTASSGTSGVNPNLAPLALIHWTIERETLDGVDYWVVFADGRDSYDPDGVAVDLDPKHGITTYLWGGSTAPATPVGLATATYVYTSDPTGETITLQVADVSLKLGTATVTITAQDMLNVQARVLWGAVSTDLLLSWDGGKVWQNVGVAAVGCCEVAHPNYQLAWTGAGAAWRVTIDTTGAFVKTLITTLSGVTAMSINIGEDGRGTKRAWAGGSGGEVYQSRDDGLTWVQVGTIGVGPITAIEESPFSAGEGQLLATAGHGQYFCFDAGVTWVLKKAYADPALVATRQASGAYSDLTTVKSYHWVVYSGTSSNTMSRVLESDNQETLDFPTGDKPVSASGLTIGLIDPELFVAGVTGSTGKIWWIDDFTGGGNLVAVAYDDSTFGHPAHLIRDGAYDAIVYGAAHDALFKTFDKFLTVGLLLALTGSQVGKMIGYGPLHPIDLPFIVTSLHTNTVVLSLWNGSSNDAPPDGWELNTFDDSTWATPVVQTAAPYSGLADTEGLWAHSPSHGTERDLFREVFTIPAIVLKKAQLFWDNDDGPAFIYVNGVQVDSWTTTPISGDDHPIRTVDILALGLLVPGAPNLIAGSCVEGFSGAGNNMGWRLEINNL